jgi:glycosyltransferase involved in cell wall biosynthesis
VKYAFVVPRYGLEVVGGAELGARMFSERLVRELGWSVEVFTTCARDFVTWANEYPAGDEVINGVRVRRFPTTSGRPPRFFTFSERLLSAPRAATSAEAEEFIELQGPGCPDLVEAVAHSDRDLLAFYPYLYTTTVRGLPAVANRAVLHPAAHDEPALHLSVFRRSMTASQGLVFHTRVEQRLVERLFSVSHIPQAVVGLGLDAPAPPAQPPARPPAIAGLGDRPYWLSLGRVDGFKGTTMLGAFFAAYKARHPGPLALVIAGPVSAQPPSHPDVFVTGPVDEADKWELLRGASVFVQPSPHESFSIVLMEAWSQGLPVVVNARCEATREHCALSGGGLWFDSYPEFEVVVDRLSADGALRETLGRRGRHFVDANYRWPALIARYGAFLEGVLDRVHARSG